MAAFIPVLPFQHVTMAQRATACRARTSVPRGGTHACHWRRLACPSRISLPPLPHLPLASPGLPVTYRPAALSRSAQIEDYTRALEVEPGNSFAFYNRGITWDRLGQYRKAIEDFTRAIEIDPGNADFYHNRGFSLRKDGRFEEAIADYSQAIRLNPKHCRAYYNRAFSFDRWAAGRKP